MKTFRQAIARLSSFLLLAVLILLPILTSASFAQEVPASDQIPDVLIWIDASNANTSSVSITYPAVISGKRAEQDLRRLLKETGWSAANINISNDSVSEADENPMTSTEFVMGSIIKPGLGVLPLEPIVKAFKRMKSIKIFYLVPQGFQFRGVGDYENKYASIKLRPGAISYEYSVTVKDPDFRTLDLPTGDTTPIAIGEHSSGLAVALVVVLALFAAGITYFVVNMATGNRRRDSS